MFSLLTKLIEKYRLIIIVLWLGAALVYFLNAPTLSEVGVTDESQFLPQDTQSASAQRLLDEKFPTLEAPASTGIIVIYNTQGLTDEDMQEAKAVRDWLVSLSGPAEVKGVTSIFDNEALSSTLVSADQTAMLMSVDFWVSPLSDEAKEAVAQIRDYLQSEHPKANIYLSGEIGLFQDLFASVQQTIDRTTLVTVILVLILLFIIYRSPVAVLLPLFAIGCSFAVARGLLGYMAAYGVPISTLADAYLVVVIFGIGTDYCLFIVSRFREELKQRERGEAQDYTMRRIGPVIAASALTVIVAFLSLGISRFGMTKTTGYALAIGVAITLLAGLTLVPALMSLFGKYLFWPTRTAGTRRKGRFGWSNIGNWVSRHPVIVAVSIVVILLLPYSALPHLSRSADIISQMSKSAESAQGYQVMREHFPMGELSPTYLLIESPQANITDSSSLQAIEEVAQSLSTVDGVSRVDYYSAPSSQLSELATQLRRLGDALGAGGGLDQLTTLQTYGQSLQNLALQHPGIVQSQNFQQVEANLTEISAIASQISISPENLPALLAQLQQVIYNLADNLEALAGEFRLEVNSPFTDYLLSTYFSTDNTTARINIALSSDPYSSETVDTIARLREAADESISISALQESSHYIGGESATQADIMFTNDADFGRVTGLATAGILIVIIILLRSLLAPLYMVATVLLNYGATLGIATWLFLDVLKHASMIYMLPIFIFVVLVALGADYNIFLVSRIREEVQKRPLREAVSHAVANTGGVITACGIILAGTFATLTTAPLQVVLQIGAAIAVGVLIDTFIVRAFLVPSLAVLAGRWSWWPSRFFHSVKK